mmetsp:Transcript_54278/g.69782  ORF Transcript_54278/g.69782 Transcript_54278/m.69782 type:complete len:102 (+) Transcript_54278:354-659(+)
MMQHANISRAQKFVFSNYLSYFISNIFSFSLLCVKVYASCTFAWFAAIALLVAVLDKDTDYLIQAGLSSGGSSEPNPYAPHDEQGANLEEDYHAPPPSADL